MKWASLVAQWLRIHLQCRSCRRYRLIPGQEDPLKEGMVAHSSILAWRIPWIEEPGGLQSMGSQRVGNNLATEHTPTIALEQSLANKGL